MSICSFEPMFEKTKLKSENEEDENSGCKSQGTFGVYRGVQRKIFIFSFNDLFIEKASVKINFVGEILNHITNNYRNNIVRKVSS